MSSGTELGKTKHQECRIEKFTHSTVARNRNTLSNDQRPHTIIILSTSTLHSDRPFHQVSAKMVESFAQN
jgi:hypothetical protein